MAVVQSVKLELEYLTLTFLISLVGHLVYFILQDLFDTWKVITYLVNKKNKL